jgi:hypothetical protein
MPRRKTIENQIKHALGRQMAAKGESKHMAKEELRKRGEYNPTERMEKIYGVQSRETAQKVGSNFANWHIRNGGSQYTQLKDLYGRAEQWLAEKRDSGKVTVNTLHTYKSGLGRIFGKTPDVELPPRTREGITRSRDHVPGNYRDEKDLVAYATQTRASDLANLNPHNFRDCSKSGLYVVDIFDSKGGKDRTSIVLPEREREVREIVERAKSEGRSRLFDPEPKKDAERGTHGYRREGIQALHKAVERDPLLKARCLKLYPERDESYINQAGERVKITADTYTTRNLKDSDGNRIPNMTFNRDCLYVCSQSLGHNRVDVVVSNYLI